MTCLTENSAFAYLGSQLPPHEIAEIEKHINRCAYCRRLVGDAATALFEAEPPGSHFDTSMHASVTAPLGSEPTGAAGFLIPGTQVGRYRIVDLIGVGAMGTVYRAYDPRLNRHVALKIVFAERSSATRIDEAEAMARLSHPHVVGVYDAGTIDGHMFVVMELVEGDTLSAWLKRAPRTWRDILSVFLDVGSGLAAAHTADLVHGDFKPANVLIGLDGRGRVTDFGLAAASLPPSLDDDPPAAPTGPHLSGTPAYMAPEQFLGQPANHVTDQFSYCVALYAALYAQHPFLPPRTSQDPPRPRTMRDYMNAMTSGLINPVPVDGAATKKRDAAPPWLFPIVAKGLARHPEDRFSGMPELLAEIQRNLAAEPPQDSPALRGRRHVRTALLGALVLLGAGLAAWRTGATRQRAVIAAPMCGNGQVEAGEECDDGNRDNGDGCESGCMRCRGGNASVTRHDGQSGTSCYTRHDTPSTWDAAFDVCANSSGHLAVVRSTAEQESVVALLGTQPGPYWLGMRDPAAKIPLSWITGDPLLEWFATTFSNFDRAPESCAGITKPAGGPVAFSWFPCATPLPFVCERRAWTVRPTNNHTYQVFLRELTWQGAKRRCESAGSHLATIADDDERRFLSDRFFGTLWIGGVREAKNAPFHWITNEPFSTQIFAPGEPDLPELEACAVLTEGQVRDRFCDGRQSGPYNVLCEVD